MMKRKKSGFTLIETILTVTIISVVALLMFSFFSQGLNLYSVETSSADEQMNQRQVLSDITNKTRVSDPSTISVTSGVLVVDSYTYIYNGKSILRNGTVIANDISAFNVSIADDILEIRIANASGEVITTSLSLS